MEKVHLLTGPYHYIKFFGRMLISDEHHKLINFVLCNRLLELTKTIRDQGSNKQVLDKLKVERERGITVKAQVSLGFQKNHTSKIALPLHHLH